MDRGFFIYFSHPVNSVNPVKTRISAVARNNPSSAVRGLTRLTGWTGFSAAVGAVQGAGQPACLVTGFGWVKSGFLSVLIRVHPWLKTISTARFQLKRPR